MFPLNHHILNHIQAIYGTLYWDPTSIVALWTSRAGAFFVAFAFGFATLGTNISTNSIATSNDFAFLVPKWLNIKRGAFITSLLGGWATCPWKIQASATCELHIISSLAFSLLTVSSCSLDHLLVRLHHRLSSFGSKSASIPTIYTH